MPMVEGKNVDRPVNAELCFSAQLSLHHNGLAQHHHYCGGSNDPSVDLLLHSPPTHVLDPKDFSPTWRGQSILFRSRAMALDELILFPDGGTPLQTVSAHALSLGQRKPEEPCHIPKAETKSTGPLDQNPSGS
ncbi:hypothetical protein AMECASPLE_037716 [Ameca splendens]|uniref:Uncharacterized protein n=1 Tax=Ameca splendens TaxID=208324 RepID=A0ABV0YVQ6_9TELE